MAESVGNDEGTIGFQIAPMVDVVFVLMIFFMACASQQVTERELTARMPSDSRLRPETIIPVCIDIDNAGQVSINNLQLGTPTDDQLSALRAKLRTHAERFGTEDPLIICPSPRTSHERVMQVLNAAASSGLKHLSFR